MRQTPYLFPTPLILIITSNDRESEEKTKGLLSKNLKFIDIDTMSKDMGISTEHITRAFQRVGKPQQSASTKNSLKEIQKILGGRGSLLQKGKNLSALKTATEANEKNFNPEIIDDIIRNFAKMFYANDTWYQTKGAGFIQTITKSANLGASLITQKEQRALWHDWIYSVEE